MHPGSCRKSPVEALGKERLKSRAAPSTGFSMRLQYTPPPAASCLLPGPGAPLAGGGCCCCCWGSCGAFLFFLWTSAAVAAAAAGMSGGGGGSNGGSSPAVGSRGPSPPAPAGVCYSSPSAGSVRELAQRARVVVEGRVQPAPRRDEEEEERRGDAGAVTPATGEELLAAFNWTSPAGTATTDTSSTIAVTSTSSTGSGNSNSSISAEGYYPVRVRVHQVWAVKAGGLEKDSLISVLGDFASCFKLKEDSRYIFFMEPTDSSSVFRASFPPLETGRNLKKEVGRVLCRGCGAGSLPEGA